MTPDDLANAVLADPSTARAADLLMENLPMVIAALRARQGVETMPLVPYLGLKTILNHVEPGWENCRTAVQQWFDTLPLPSLPPHQEQRS